MGKGRMRHANGNIYDGWWKKGLANGQGYFLDNDGSHYKGSWMNDL